MTPITFSKRESIPTVTAPAEILAESGPPTFTNVTSKSITIAIRNTVNTVVTDTDYVVDFDTTPANIIENFTGDGVLNTFTIVQALSGATYSVGSVTINGVSQVLATHYTVTGQFLTFTTPPALNDAIVVTLEHVPDQ